jgi:hypothetical protein
VTGKVLVPSMHGSRELSVSFRVTDRGRQYTWLLRVLRIIRKFIVLFNCLIYWILVHSVTSS